VNYLGSAGHHLTNGININRFAGDLISNPSQIGQFHGLNASFAAINMVQSTSNSIYNGATVSVKHVFNAGFTVQGGYTFSKAIDDTDQETSNTNWQDAWNRQAERGLAGFDTTHRLTINGLWNLPFFKNKDQMKLAHYVLGGWELSGVTILDNGSPFTITNGATFSAITDSSGRVIGNKGGDYNADNNAGDRPNAPTGNIQSSGWSRQQFLTGIFKVTDFGVPTPGTDGNLGRTTYRGPGFAETDLSLAKRFMMGERFSALLRVDAYNAFNRVNLNNPVADMSSSNFGKVTSQNTPRLFQVGLKLRF